jgi:ribonuclease P/MRP protein subunit POP5
MEERVVMPPQKLSLKPLKPTLRGKKRYIEFRLFCEKNLDERSVERAIFSTFLALFGSFGVAKQNLRLIKFNNGSNKGILRCSLPCLEEAKSGLLFIREINGNPVTPKITKVSGSLKKLKGRKNK